MKKVHYTWSDIEHMCVDISVKMYKDKWMPDYIVGITRGGNVPATIISNMLDVPGEALKVSLRDNQFCETNTWMAEDAFGVNYESQTGISGCRWDISLRKNILIIDDINDSGETFKWIKNDWESSCFPHEEEAWKSVWHHNVKFAALTYNIVSEADIDYWSDECNKLETPTWQVYPWEVVGKHEV
jgi:hypoxanthine phosphoribosyltransferase